MALLVLAVAYCEASGAACLAVTVDHGLRPEARDEVRFVAAACQQLGVAHAALSWAPGERPGPVGQQEAREARHRLLAVWARRNGVDRLALGHTRDDRLETFLMRARQGSGWHGLAGLMPEGPSPVWPEGAGLTLFRPLLAFGRADLRGELAGRGWSWIEDPSNDTARFERVRMRRLLPRLSPDSRRKALDVMDRLTLMRTAVLAEANALLSQLSDRPDAEARWLPMTARALVGDEAWRRFVEAQVMAAGGARRPPRTQALDRLLAKIAGADPALTRGVTLAGARIRLHKDGVLAFSRAPARRGQPETGPPDWTRANRLLGAPDLRSLSV